MHDEPRPHAGPDGSGRPPVSTDAMRAPAPPPPGYLPPAYPAPPKTRGVASKVLTSLLATVILLSIGLNIYFGIFYAAVIAAGASESEYRAGSGEERVVIVPVVGGIDAEMQSFVRGAFKSLDKKPPAAIVLRVDSGGGGVTASDQIWHTIKAYKAKHPEVEVVASFGGIAASGGYYVATPTDYIFCEQTGITGSIGVIAQIPSVEGMIEKLGVEMNVVVADGSTEKATANNLFEDWQNESGELTEEGEKNQAVIKNLLNSAWARFVEVVDEGRPALSTAEVEALATGDIFTAGEALENGLINEVGYLDDAVDKAIAMAGLDPQETRVTMVRERQAGLLGLLGARSGGGVSVSLGDVSPEAVRTWLEELGEVRLSYRVQFE
ncbi:MAG: S49 family peptidase [Planctomycetota bacterium]